MKIINEIERDADGQTNVEFIAYPGQVWFADSNLGDDKQDRLFVSGDTGVKWTERVEPYQDAQGHTVTTKVWHDATESLERRHSGRSSATFRRLAEVRLF